MRRVKKIGRFSNLIALIQFKMLVLLLLLFFIVPVVFLDAHENLAFWGCVATMVAASIFAIKRKSIGLTYYLIYFLFILMAPFLVQSSTGVTYLSGIGRTTSPTSLTFAFICVHVIGLLIGSVIGTIYRTSSARTLSIAMPKSSLLRVLAISAIVIFIGAVVIGLNVFFGVRSDVHEDFIETGGITRFIFYVSKIIPFVAVMFYLEYMKLNNNRSKITVSGIILLFAAVMISNPLNTARFISLLGISMVAMQFLIMSKKFKIIDIAVFLAPPLLIVVLSATSVLRHGFGEQSLFAVSDRLQTVEFSSFQYLIDGLNIMSDNQSGGLYTLSAILVFLPREIWSSKAGALFEIISPQGYYVTDNIAITSSFSGYADLGFVGVLLVSSAMGYALSRIRFDRGISVLRRRHFYALALFCLVPVLARGSLNLFFVGYYALAVAYEIVRWVARVRPLGQSTR